MGRKKGKKLGEEVRSAREKGKSESKRGRERGK